MKRFHLIVLAMLCAVFPAGAYDWQHQENEQLRSDMIAFAEGFASRCSGQRQVRSVLKEFVRKQKRKAATSPYAWIADTKDVVLRLEALCPPVQDDGSAAAQTRRDILLLLDFPLHADNRHAQAPQALKDAFDATSGSYRAQGRERAMEILSRPGPTNPGELQVIKIYNCGVILRTSFRTVAVDIKWEGDGEGAAKIARAADIFFLSHPHRDHYSDAMINALAAAGKPAILPSNVVPDAMWDGKQVIFEDRLQPFETAGIKVNIVTGHQKALPNNSYLLEFDGWRVMLPGETHEFDKLEAFTAMQAPDLILEPTWNRADITFDIAGRMPGYSSGDVIFIPEHENELTHTVDHRESYRELFTREDRLGNPAAAYPRVYLLDIGESLTLKKAPAMEQVIPVAQYKYQ